jgi:preprotein translocase subunit SecF
MFVVKYRKIFLTFSAILTVVAIGLVLIFGLRLSIDFTGGALTTVSYPDGRPDRTALNQSLSSIQLGEISLREAGSNEYMLRTRDLTEAERVSVVNALSLGGSVKPTIEQYTSIGPTIGTELRNKAIIGLVIVILAIVIYIAFAFRKVSEPVPSWKYGLIAVITLIHDVMLPTGVFAVLGHFSGVTVDTLFLTALLVILGYSINDTIIIFDRIRENLKNNHEHSHHESFEETVGKSLHQTYARSINTSMTVLITLIAIYFLGGVGTENFALALIIGVAAGAYSSIFIAAPLLVLFEKLQHRRAK